MTEPQAKRPKLATPGSVVIDQDGDALLVIGSDTSNPELSIQVSSKVLSVASKVFKAMFSRNFQEGIQLALEKGSLPVKIPLPDDQPNAILTLCKVLHYDTSDLAITHDITKLQDFAAIADKYDCVLACMFYGRAWLTFFWEDSCALPEILAIAYLFDDPNTFKKVSATLLLSGDGVDAMRKFQKTASIMLPIDVCDALDKKRLKMERRISANLMLPISTLARSGRWCKETPKDENEHRKTTPKCTKEVRIFQYIKELQEDALWPVLTQHWNLGSTIQYLDVFNMTEKFSACCAACCKWLNDYISKLHEELEVKSKQGVCLDCLHRAMSSEGENDSPSGLEAGADVDSASSGNSSSGSESSEDDDEDEVAVEVEDEIVVEVEADDAHCRVKH